MNTEAIMGSEKTLGALRVSKELGRLIGILARTWKHDDVISDIEQ
jgi:hypothetical protein